MKLKNEQKNEDSSLQRLISSKEFQGRQIEKNIAEITKDKKYLEDFNSQVSENQDNLYSLKSDEDKILKDFESQKSILDEKKEQQNKLDLEQRGKRQYFDRVSQKLIDSQVKIRENEVRIENIINSITKKYEISFSYDTSQLYLNDEFKKYFEIYSGDSGTFDLIRAEKEVEELSERLKKLGGYQPLVWENFDFEKEELEKMISQRNDLHESEKDIRKTIERINSEARERFLKTFDEIRQNFIRIFKELFQEADEANLRLVYDVDEEGNLIEDPLEAKIEITAKPRGKKPTSIELLSGGEKALTAIALLFAIYLVKPSPFCVLDEVDAPLDPANLARFNKMIRKFSQNTQFILITHNERTMETVDRLYGITMQEPGVTTIVETKFKNN